MTALILGLLIFLGVHSVRIFADGWRTQTRARIGEQAWKGAYSVLSLLGFVLLVWGYGQARQQPVVLWASPTWTRHLAALLTLPAFIMIFAANVPGNAIKSRLKHPMVLGVKVWAAAHLLANGRVEHLVLFGAFLAWSVLDFRSCRQRDRALGVTYPPGNAAATVRTVIVGAALWAAFAFWAHGWLIGVKPFG